MIEPLTPEKFVEEMSQGLGAGPLTLGIFCTKCDAKYELNIEAVSMAILFKSTLLDYIKFVQSGKCDNCENTKPTEPEVAKCLT